MRSGLFFLLVLFSLMGYSQAERKSTDTTQKLVDTSSSVKVKHSPRIATLLSAVVPGAGQVYNRKYWKVPVLYAGLGVLGYMIIDNRKNYIYYRDAFKAKSDLSLTDKFPTWTADQLKQRKDYYRGNMELSVMISVGVYFINIVDATVDAHLFGFDMSEDLSLSVHPNCYYACNQAYPGFSLSFNIH